MKNRYSNIFIFVVLAMCSSYLMADGQDVGAMVSWQQISTDTDNWTSNSGTTPSSGTGPSQGASGGSYQYLETSSGHAYGNGDYAELQSGSFNPTGKKVKFYYHMYGADIGKLELRQLTSNGSWQTLWSKTGQQQSSSGSSWKLAQVDLLSFGSAQSRLRFRATAAGGYRGDIAIDNIAVVQKNERVAWRTNGGAHRTLTGCGWDGFDDPKILHCNGKYVAERRDNISGGCHISVASGYLVNGKASDLVNACLNYEIREGTSAPTPTPTPPSDHNIPNPDYIAGAGSYAYTGPFGNGSEWVNPYCFWANYSNSADKALLCGPWHIGSKFYTGPQNSVCTFEVHHQDFQNVGEPGACGNYFVREKD